MIDAVRVALTAVRSQPPPATENGLNLVGIEGCNGAFVGVDEMRKTHLLLTLTDTDTPLPESELATLAITSRPLLLGSRTVNYADVICLFDSVGDVFEHFAAAIVEQVREGLSSAAALSQVLEKWREFLAKAGSPPGRSKVAGIYGELLFLRDLLIAAPGLTAEVWMGPSGGRHDFRKGPRAVEVKTTMRHTSRDVTIHGEDQLLEPDGGELHLHVVRLEHVPGGGGSLPALVDDVLARGASAELLFAGMAAAGLPAADLSATADVTFEIRERFTVPVDDRLPRIMPASFIGGERPLGVRDITYVIDLDHSLPQCLTDPQYQAMLVALSGG